MFVTDGLWQIGREKAKECKGKVEGWTCTESERDEITVALAWELPPLDLNMQEQVTPCQRSALASALTMTPDQLCSLGLDLSEFHVPYLFT